MARQLFGTDGVRGTANIPPMTAAMALRLGLAAGRQFIRGDHRHLVVIGKDTRLSGYMFEPALTAGFIAMGMDVTLVGPVPTPALAMLTRSLRADLGVMISASHNPYQDNGIKLFGPDGYKFSDGIEQAIEERMRRDPDEDLAPPERLGRAERLDSARGRYIEWVKASFPRDLSLSGLKVVVDCAHGAAYAVAPKVLWELGADVVAIGVNPDGCNINADCGSVHPEAMQRAVLAHNADLGIALDGDADRLVLADERGDLIDGDQVLAVIAASWRARGALAGNAVVATHMSNFGLERHLADQGIRLHRSQVGDRYVVERMRELGLNLGGEQSGHLILADFGTTGDGLVAALQVLAVLLRQGRPLSEFGRPFKPLPQSVRNVRLNGGQPLERPEVRDAIAAAEACLNGCGRLLVRPSGTEPVVRVMVEAEDEVVLGRILAEVGGTVERYA